MKYPGTERKIGVWRMTISVTLPGISGDQM